MNYRMKVLLAAADQCAGATADCIDAARDGDIRPISNVGSGDTHIILADALRLLIEATTDADQPDLDLKRLHGACVRFLEDRA